jgi:hypothetical protein
MFIKRLESSGRNKTVIPTHYKNILSAKQILTWMIIGFYEEFGNSSRILLRTQFRLQNHRTKGFIPYGSNII